MMNRIMTPALMIVAMAATWSGSASAQQIKVTQFEVTHPAKHKVRVEIHARGGDQVELGSFFMRFAVPVGPDHALPAGFYRSSQGFVYLESLDSGKPSPHHLDNGKRDEDSRQGVWVVTLDTSDWPEGRYTLTAGADNRPGTGTYYHDSKFIEIVVGDPPEEPLMVSNAPQAEHQIIYKKEGIYACFPSLKVLGPKTFVTGFGTRTRASHIDPTGGSQTLISEDGGYSWREATERVVNPRWKTSWGALVDPGIQGWAYVPAEKQAELEQQHKYIRPVRPGTIAYLSEKAYCRVSQDGGQTWEKHEIEVPDYVSGMMGYHGRAAGLVTSDGLRLLTVYGKRVHDDKSIDAVKDEIFFLRSEDDGRTWDFVPMLPEGLGDLPVGFNETAIIQNEAGEIIAMMRSDPAGYLWQSVSHDRGLTWSRPEKTQVWGFPADLLKLEDGRILCVYGYRRSPMGVRAVWSEDGGKTWEADQEIIIRGDGFGSPGDLGYPLTAQLPDGTIFTIYYLTTREGVTHIAGTHWRMPGGEHSAGDE